MITETVYRKEGRTGSYARGFKFTTTEYKMLERKGKYGFTEYSLDNGKTWGTSEFYAWKASDRKDRVKVGGNTRKEFSYDAIQNIRAQYGM